MQSTIQGSRNFRRRRFLVTVGIVASSTSFLSAFFAQRPIPDLPQPQTDQSFGTPDAQSTFRQVGARPNQQSAPAPVGKTLQGAATGELKKHRQYAALKGAVQRSLYGFKASSEVAHDGGATNDKDARSFRAGNARQNFAAHFDARGVQVKTASGEALRLQWQSVEREGAAVQRVALATPTLKGEELQLRRAGATEWFRNSDAGLEQGFTLYQRPAGKGDEVRLTLAANGLKAKTKKEQIALLDDKGNTALTYSKLKVWDANGKVLPSRMEAKDGKILLVMRDDGARYPVTVDPLLASQQAYLKASNTEANDIFGFAVAIDGNTAVISAYTESSNATGINGNQADNSASEAGAVYVFVRTGTIWSQQAYLKASNTDAGDQFGFDVAIDGNTIVVGARGEASNATGVNGNQADNSAGFSGAAYVFTRSGTTWSQQAYLKASNSELGDRFGSTVDVNGDTIVVGAEAEASNATGINGNQADNSALSTGAAYVFTRSGTTWSQQAYLKASNAEAFDNFGGSVAVDGDTIAVGAVTESSNATGINGNQANNSASQAGAVYVFTRSGTSWSQQAYLKAFNTNAGDHFGRSVAISGESIVVGANDEDSAATGVGGNQADNSASNAGAAYVFTRLSGLGGFWIVEAYLKASNTGNFDNFGWAVDISGDVVVVGAYQEDSNATGINGDGSNNGAQNSGAAYLYQRNSGAWALESYIKASNTEAIDFFAQSVAVSGTTALVGAEFESSDATGVNGSQANNNAASSGATYVYSLDPAQSGADFVVNVTDDIEDGTCGTNHCSLREAINAANSNANASIISFDPTVFATLQTIALDGTQLPPFTTPTTINGPIVGVTIDGGAASRIMRNNGATVNLNRLTLYRGSSTFDIGTGLLNDSGNMTLDQCTISNNSITGDDGGGVANYSVSGLTATMLMTNCTINNNSAPRGAGIFNHALYPGSTATMAMNNCTLYGNTATVFGAGGYNHSDGGASASLTVTNCTFNGNSAGSGASLTNGKGSTGPATITLGNTILGNAANNLFNSGGAITSAGNNLARDNSSAFLNQSGDLNSTNPLLGAPGNNGGPTLTIALLTGSPAINAGNNALLPADTTDADGDSNTGEPIPYDQRGPGFLRIQGTNVDIGAYEIAVLNVNAPTITEGNAGTGILTFTVALSSVTSQNVTFTYQTATASTLPAMAGTDYVAIPATTGTIIAGQIYTTINVTINGDLLDEANERVRLLLTNPANAATGMVQEGVVIDDDATPSLSIDDIEVTESNGGTVQAVFTVSLSAASGQTVTVQASTNAGGGSPAATAGTDYTAVTNTTIIFLPGQTTRSFNVSVLGDMSDEADEKFGVSLSGAVNASLSDNSGVGTILDNDNPPTISVSAPNLTEGNSGTSNMTFTLSLSAASGRNISVQYQTVNASTLPATSGTDYNAVPLTTVIFAPSQTTKTVNVAVKGDVLDEANEHIKLNLQNPVNTTLGTVSEGIIVDDDAAPSLSINDLSVNEGNSGTKLMLFTVTLSAPSGQTVTVNAATGAGGSPAATAGTDYGALAATQITFAPGQTSKQVSVTIYGDTTVEPNEKFGVVLSGAVNATLADNSGIGTILNDDAAGVAAPAEAPSGDDASK